MTWQTDAPAKEERIIVITTPRRQHLKMEFFKSKQEAEDTLIGRRWLDYEDMIIIQGGKRLSTYLGEDITDMCIKGLQG